MLVPSDAMRCVMTGRKYMKNAARVTGPDDINNDENELCYVSVNVHRYTTWAIY